MTWPRQCRTCALLIYPKTHGHAPAAETHAGRGLCVPCYGRARYAGTLIDAECAIRTRDEVMTEWDILRGQGYSKKQAAARLGMTFAGFDTAFHRARRAGDPRAVVTVSKARG